MKIKFQQFLGCNHSWAHVGHNLATSFLKKNHQIHLCSTDGIEQVPNNLRPFLKSENQLDPDYDLAISYTAPHNWPHYLSGARNKFAIWNYETDVVPGHFIKYWNSCDLVLPSSQFSFDIFAKSGAPVNKMKVISHGINLEDYQNKTEIYPLKTKKTRKILVNIAQPHLRKNISGILEAYGKTFSIQDDVCLVLKIVMKTSGQPHEVDVKKILNSFYLKYPKHGEIELVTDFINDISDLYRSCDVIFSMSHSENFWLPGLEMASLGKLIICPRYGGQLDYLSDSNSFLIIGKIVKAPYNFQYWVSSPYASIFQPDINSASEILRDVIDNYEFYLSKMSDKLKETANNLTWDRVAEEIIKLTV